MKIAIVGVTGLVGGVLLKVLEERGFSGCQLIPAASEKSVGKEVFFAGKMWKVLSVESAIASKPDFVIFSAGSAPSLMYAPQFAANGAYVIDNSSAWRSYEHIPLVVPEINGEVIKREDRIIANPNCSTIQMVMVLAPLHRRYQLKRVVVSTYQSVTGTGIKAVKQLMSERAGEFCERAYPHQIDLNVLPFGGTFVANGHTTEEIKLVNETRKILQSNSIGVSATVVRVPVKGGHSEAVNAQFEHDFDLNEVVRLLDEFPGVTVFDNPARNEYPMPLMTEGRDEVFAGRIRRDDSQANTLNIWIVSDNLRKGAATNAVQILELIKEKFGK